MSRLYQDIQVKIYIITYRRPILLKRAINSLIAQTHKNWVAEILNDDPDDDSVGELVNQIADPRISLALPMVKRGGAGNFNQAFKQSTCPFTGMLEDDNWFEPNFIEVMLKALIEHPKVNLAVSNEKIWREEADGSWTDTNTTVWLAVVGSELYNYHLSDKCGSAKICNSSMLWRTDQSSNWTTPNDLPIDVTEHFRERALPHPLLLINAPLVNFAQTRYTNRSQGLIWSSYQVLLISSVFIEIDAMERVKLAEFLWAKVYAGRPQFHTTLLHTALSHKSAFVLLKTAKTAHIAKYILTWIRRPISCFKIIRSRQRYPNHWNFLLQHLVGKEAIL